MHIGCWVKPSTFETFSDGNCLDAVCVCVCVCVCGWAPEGEGVLDRIAAAVRRSVEEDLCLA